MGGEMKAPEWGPGSSRRILCILLTQSAFSPAITDVYTVHRTLYIDQFMLVNNCALHDLHYYTVYAANHTVNDQAKNAVYLHQ